MRLSLFNITKLVLIVLLFFCIIGISIMSMLFMNPERKIQQKFDVQANKFSKYMKFPEGVKENDRRLSYQTPPQSYTSFRGKNYLRTIYSLDYKDMTISIWAHLMDSTLYGDQIIVGNRFFGCTKKMEAFGYLVFFSKVDDTRFTLNVIVHTTTNGCETLTTYIPIQDTEKWIHIGIVFKSEGKKTENDMLSNSIVCIYVNGVILLTNFVSRFINRDQPFSFGISNDNSAPFYGSLASFSIYDIALTEGDIFLLSRGGELADIVIKQSKIYLTLDPVRIDEDNKWFENMPLQIINIKPYNQKKASKKVTIKDIQNSLNHKNTNKRKRNRNTQLNSMSPDLNIKHKLRYDRLESTLLDNKLFTNKSNSSSSSINRNILNEEHNMNVNNNLNIKNPNINKNTINSLTMNNANINQLNTDISKENESMNNLSNHKIKTDKEFEQEEEEKEEKEEKDSIPSTSIKNEDTMKNNKNPIRFLNKNKPSASDLLTLLNDDDDDTPVSMNDSEEVQLEDDETNDETDTEEDILSQKRLLEKATKLKEKQKELEKVTKIVSKESPQPSQTSISKNSHTTPSTTKNTISQENSMSSEDIQKNTKSFSIDSSSTSVSYEQYTKTIRTTLKSNFASGLYSFTLPDTLKEEFKNIRLKRTEEVETMMSFAWMGYKTFAWGKDEMGPVTGGSRNNWGDIAMTLIDSLDTLYLMNRTEDLSMAKDYIENILTFDQDATVSVFETTIRVLGGLLSIYELTNDSIYLTKAQDMGDRLSRAFETQSGLPHARVNLKLGAIVHGNTKERVGLAEFGTLALEFRTLSYHTKDNKYSNLVNNIYESLYKLPTRDGLFPVYFDLQTGVPHGNALSIGSMGDSYYEYLLKVYIHNNKQESKLLHLYQDSLRGTQKKLLKRNTPDGYLYAGRTVGQRLFHEMTLLTCFYPGLLVLGIMHNVTDDSERDIINAKSLMYTCYSMFMKTPTHLAPEYVTFPKGGRMTVSNTNPSYILRPETIESLYLLYQYTKDPIYIEWGWDLFTAINSTCRARHGYGIYKDVRERGHEPEDRTETFFFSELVKYFYMLFNPKEVLNLHEYVLNTEAHPLKIYKDMNAGIIKEILKENNQDDEFT